ncbi:MAG: MFS transporter [Deltaproteobacteria bacterium]|nr:MFS transporter [Deltaproteobacteria bacterium]
MKKETESEIGLILLAFIAFVSLGLSEGLLGVAWPSMRESLSLPLDSLGVLLFAVMAGYLTSSLVSGRLVARLGVGRLLALSCAAAGAGLIGYTLVPAWWMILALGVLTGLGAGAIDSSLNAYVAANFGKGLMQWLHANWGIGITTGPLIMTAGIHHFNDWRWGYVWVGAAQFTLAACFALTSPFWRRCEFPGSFKENPKPMADQPPLSETLRQPEVWLSILFFFLCAGMEAVLGNWVYTLLSESRGLLPRAAGLWTGSYWAAFTASRVLMGLSAKRIPTHALIRGCLLMALVGAMFLWWNPVNIGLFGVVIVGFSMAPVFPGLVSGTGGRVGGRHAANTIGMQICGGGVGAAVLPWVGGILAQRSTLEILPAYLGFGVAVLYGLYSWSVATPAEPNAGR